MVITMKNSTEDSVIPAKARPVRGRGIHPPLRHLHTSQAGDKPPRYGADACYLPRLWTPTTAGVTENCAAAAGAGLPVAANAPPPHFGMLEG